MPGTHDRQRLRLSPEFKNQIVGLIRFSYPAKGGFAKGFDSAEQAEAFLYEPARLERRFHLFEKMCLPALQAQGDGAFTLVILTGDTLPDSAKARLKGHLKTLADGRLVTLPTKPHYGAMKAALRQVAPGKASHRTSFRLDDDDALASDYIARLRARAEQVHALGQGQPVAIAFNRGLYVRLQDSGNEVFDAVERTPLSVGSALVAPIGQENNIYARNHRFLPQFFDTVSEAATPTWIRTIHADNDSDPFIQGKSHMWDDAQIDAALKKGFAQSMSDLKAL